MPQIGNWNGHVFEVSDRLIRGFTELSIQGGCETTEKNTNEQKYVERKYGNAQSISLVVGLNALLGVTDVQGEAMQFVAEAEAGATAYFYLGSRKLVSCQMMLTRADVVEIVTAPGRGDRWISCNVRITLQQASDNDGGIPASDAGAGSSGESGGKAAETETPTASGQWPPDNKEIATFAVSTALGVATGNLAALAPAITLGAKGAINFVKNAMEKAKANSAKAKGDTPAMTERTIPQRRLTAAGGVNKSTNFAATSNAVNSKTKTSNDSSQKTNATTGRSTGGDKVDAITMAAPSVKMTVDRATQKIVEAIH